MLAQRVIGGPREARELPQPLYEGAYGQALNEGSGERSRASKRPAPAEPSSHKTPPWREKDSNHRYPAKFFGYPVDPRTIHLPQYKPAPSRQDQRFKSISLQGRVSQNAIIRAAAGRVCAVWFERNRSGSRALLALAI